MPTATKHQARPPFEVSRLGSAYSEGLDALRVIAALLVVIGHVRGLLFVPWEQVEKRNAWWAIFYGLSGLGHQAVVVFFALSGYWVGGQALRSVRRDAPWLRRYFTARVARLSIVSLPALAISGLVAHVLLRHFAEHPIVQDPVRFQGLLPLSIRDHLSVEVLAGNLFFLQGFMVPTYAHNGPLWSLSYEFWYYMIFPAIIILANPKKMSGRSWPVLAILTLPALLQVGWPFVAGLAVWCASALLSIHHHRIRSREAAWPPVAVGARRLVLLVGAVAVCLLDSVGFIGGIRGVLAVGAASIVIIYELTEWQAPRIRIVSVGTRVLAGSSFSLYATHMPVVCLVIAAAGWTPRTPSNTRVLLVVLIVILAAAFATAFAFLTERHTKRVVTRLTSTGGACRWRIARRRKTANP